MTLCMLVCQFLSLFLSRGVYKRQREEQKGRQGKEGERIENQKRQGKCRVWASKSTDRKLRSAEESEKGSRGRGRGLRRRKGKVARQGLGSVRTLGYPASKLLRMKDRLQGGWVEEENRRDHLLPGSGSVKNRYKSENGIDFFFV